MAEINLPTLVQRIRVDTRDMEAAEKRAASMSRKLKGAVDDTEESTGKLGTTSEQTAKDVDDLGDSAKKTSKDVKHLTSSTEDAVDGVDGLGKTAKKTSRDVDGLGESVRKTRRETDQTGDAARRTARDIEGLGAAARRSQRGFRGLRPFLRPALYYGISSFIAPAITSLNALGGAALAAAGGIAPATGALAAFPSFLGAIVSTTAGFKTATKGTLDAASAIVTYGKNSEEAKEALKGLSPEARKYSTQLVPFIKRSKEASDQLRRFALPGFTKGLKAAYPVMSVFKSAAADIGKELGKGGKALGEFVGSKGFLTDLRVLSKTNTSLVGNFRRSLVPLVSTLRNIMVAASPMTRSLGDATEQLAKFLDSSTSKNRGKMTAFFDRAGRAAISLTKAIGSTGAAIGRIAGIGANVFGGSDGITKSMERGAKRFSDWTKSADGKNSIKQYFEDIKPVAKEIGLLGKDLLKAFASLSRDPDTAGLIRKIRVDLLPSIVTLLEKSSELAPAIVDILTGLTDVIAALDPQTLQIIAGALSLTAKALAGIANHVPGFAEFVSLALAYAAIRRFPGLGGILPSIGTIAKRGKTTITGGGVAGGGKAGKAGGGTTVLGGGGSKKSSKKSTTKTSTKKAPKVRGGAGLGGVGATAGLLIVPQLAISPAETAAGKGESGALSAFEIIEAYNDSKKTQKDREQAADGLRKSAKEIEDSSKGFGGALLYGVNDVISKIKGEPTLTQRQGSAATALRNQAAVIEGKPRVKAPTNTFSQSSKDLAGGLLKGASPGLLGLSALVPDTQGVIDKLKGVFATGTAQLSGQAGTGGIGIREALMAPLALIPGNGSSILSSLATRVTSGLGISAANASTGGVGITQRIRTAFSIIPGIGSSILTVLAGRFTSGLATARTIASAGATLIVGAVRTRLNRMVGAAREAVSNAASRFGGLVSQAISALGDGSALYGAGVRLMGMLAAGIAAGARVVGGAIAAVARTVANYLPGSPVKTGPLTKFNRGGVGVQLAQMLADGLVAGGPTVASAARAMVAGVNPPAIGATVAASNAITAAAPATAGSTFGVASKRTNPAYPGAVDRSINVAIDAIYAGREETGSDALTRKLSVMQAAGVFG